MPAYDLKLVTIVCEALAREAVTRLLHQCGAHGHTIFEVEGTGSRGQRTSDIAEFSNIQVEAVVTPEVCERIMATLETEFFPNYGMIAFESDVRVRRPGKF